MAILEHFWERGVEKGSYGDGLIPLPEKEGWVKVVHAGGIVIVNLIHSRLARPDMARFFQAGEPHPLDLFMAREVRGLNLTDRDEFLVGPVGKGYWFLSLWGLQGSAYAVELGNEI